MQIKTQTVAAAPNNTIIFGAGTYFRLLSCPNPVDIEFNKDTTPIATMSQVGTGLAWNSRDEDGKLKPYTKGTITSAVAQTIQYAYGYGELLLDLATGTVGLTKSQNLSDTADTSVAASGSGTINANTARRVAIIGNPIANAGIFRVGSAPTATRGQEVKPGESISIESAAQIKVFNTGAGAQSFSLLEVLD